MTGRLAGKKAIITGASNGIGLAIAKAFVREGADLLVTGNTNMAGAYALAEQAKEQGRHVAYIQLACQETSAVEKLFSAADSLLGPADILVNNAACATRSSFLEISEQEYKLTLEVNTAFPFFSTQRFARANVARGAPGNVINVASISAFKAISRMSAYQCSKAALAMLTKSSALELAQYGIRVNTLSPGLTATNANANQWRDNPLLWQERSKDLPLGRTGVPEDLSGAALFLASDESSWMTGGNIVVDGGDSVI
jgi:glucose 1-dehydrogenase